MPPWIIGRERELAAVDEFVARAAERLRVFVVEGPAGIGKSTIWLRAVASAQDRGFHVLTSRPAEAEQSLANVVLGDLFANVPDVIVGALPVPRRRAFEAMLLRGGSDAAIDVRALGVAIVGILEALASERHVFVAIDDVQWIDPASAAALRFAARRVIERPITLFLAGRLLDGDVPLRPGTLEIAPDGIEVERLRVGPLSVGALQAVLRQRLDVALPRPALLQLHEESAGNPFHALELAKLGRRASGDPGALATSNPSLTGLVLERLDGLGDAGRDALLLVAANGRTRISLLDALGVPSSVLRTATAAGILEQAGAVVQFSHPLLASTVYAESRMEDRAIAHRRLAQTAADPAERLRHLALAVDGPDEPLASELEREAGAALAHGHPLTAADLAGHAVRLTPPTDRDAADGRSILVARAHAAAGEGSAARSIAAAVLQGSTNVEHRVAALLMIAAGERLAVARDLVRQASVEATGDPSLETLTRIRLADAARLVRAGSWAEAHATAAAATARSLGDAALEAAALALLAELRFGRADPDALGLAAHAYELAREARGAEHVVAAALAMAHVLVWSGDADRGRAWIQARLTEWRDRDEVVRSNLIWYLALAELWAGRWTIAHAHASEAMDIATQYGLEVPQVLLPLSLIELHQGHIDRARAHSARALELAPETLLPTHHSILATCDLWQGDAAAAIVHFAQAEAAADARGISDPGLRHWQPEHAEALVRLGRLDDAARLADEMEHLAARLGRGRVMGHALRCRGLLTAARGDVPAAIELLERSVQISTLAHDPFGRARALLALGSTRRRARQKRAAREAIGDAVTEFERLGAASWVAAGRRELGRIGGRTKVDRLTDSERRVAELVAAGQTNREIAAALFLGERTVASHLTHIYAKLGIRSRTELARHILRSADSETGASKVPTS